MKADYLAAQCLYSTGIINMSQGEEKSAPSNIDTCTIYSSSTR